MFGCCLTKNEVIRGSGVWRTVYQCFFALGEI